MLNPSGNGIILAATTTTERCTLAPKYTCIPYKHIQLNTQAHTYIHTPTYLHKNTHGSNFSNNHRHWRPGLFIHHNVLYLLCWKLLSCTGSIFLFARLQYLLPWHHLQRCSCPRQKSSIHNVDNNSTPLNPMISPCILSRQAPVMPYRFGSDTPLIEV